MATIRRMHQGDRESVTDIFNYYVENGLNAFPEEKMPYSFFDEVFLKGGGYPRIVAENEAGKVVGFAMLRPHNPIPAFRETCEITCFIKPEMTGRGLGTQMIRFLIEEAGSRGIRNILAAISSVNKGSVDFHRRQGFKECGRFAGIGRKKGVSFDVIWMQLTLSEK